MILGGVKVDKEKEEEMEKAMQLLRRLAGEEVPPDAAPATESAAGEEGRSKSTKPKARAESASKASGVAAVEEGEGATWTSRAAPGEAGPSMTSDEEKEANPAVNVEGGVGPVVVSKSGGQGEGPRAVQQEDVEKAGTRAPVKKRGRPPKSKASERGVASAVSD